jgi:AcrR family transcriptional regulator
MGRPPLITDDELLAVAREVFLAEGVGASTATIAKRAGISEAAVFKRFPSKQTLLVASLRPAAATHWTKELPALAGTGDLKENLIELSVKMIGFFRAVLPRLMLIWAYRREARDEDRPVSAPLRSIDALVEFLSHEQRLGRLGTGEPTAIARVIVGSTFTYAFLETIGARGGVAEPETYARDVVEALWTGIGPTPPRVAPQPTAGSHTARGRSRKRT